MNHKILFAIIGFAQIYIIATQYYTSKIVRVECEFNKKYIINTICKLRLQRNGSNLMSYGGEVTKTLPIIFVDLKVYYRFNARFKFFSLKFTKNICDIKWAEKDYKPDAIVGIYYYALKKYSNVIVPCPYYKGNYSLANITADVFKYPPIVPAGEYRVDIRLHNGEKETYTTNKVYAIVKAIGTHDLKMK